MSGLNEHDITAVEHEIFLESATGQWTEAQIKAVRDFRQRLLKKLLEKLEQELINGQPGETPSGCLHLELRSPDDMVKYATEEISGMGIAQKYKTKLLGMIMAISQRAGSAEAKP